MARQFVQSAGSITFPSVPSIDDIGAGGLSVIFWGYHVSGSGTGNNPTIVSKSTVWQVRFIDASAANPRLRFVHTWSGTDVDAHTSSGSPSSGRWTHFTVTYNGGTSASSSIRFYYDGVEVTNKSNNSNATGSIDLDAGNDLVIGGFSPIMTLILAHVCVYNRALAAGEISKSFLESFIIQHGLRLYCPIVGTSSPEPDLSSFNRMGTLSSTTTSPRFPPVFFPMGESQGLYPELRFLNSWRRFFQTTTPSITVSPSALTLTLALKTSSAQVDDRIDLTPFPLTTVLPIPFVGTDQDFGASALALTISLKSPTIQFADTHSVGAAQALVLSLKAPTVNISTVSVSFFASAFALALSLKTPDETTDISTYITYDPSANKLQIYKKSVKVVEW